MSNYRDIWQWRGTFGRKVSGCYGKVMQLSHKPIEDYYGPELPEDWAWRRPAEVPDHLVVRRPRLRQHTHYNPPKRYEHVCDWCYADFWSEDKHGRFCSERCVTAFAEAYALEAVEGWYDPPKKQPTPEDALKELAGKMRRLSGLTARLHRACARYYTGEKP